MTNEINCGQMEELLPDYLQQSLGTEQEEGVELHLRSCAECRDLVAMWNRLGLLPAEKAGAHLRDRFGAMLHAYQEAREEIPRKVARPNRVVPFLARPAWQMWVAVAACALMLVGGGFLAGRGFGPGQPESHSAGEEVATLRRELADMRQLMVLSMMQQQSASDRMQAISYTTQQGQLDPRVMEALVGALRFDPNVDVRLAALDALSRHDKQPQVQEGIVQALQPQQSPLVQVALINQIVESRDRDARQRLLQIKEDPKVHPVVRQRVDWALSHLN